MQHLIYQKFHNSFHMQTFINLISLCFVVLHLFFLIIQIRKSEDLCMSKHCLKIANFQKSKKEMCPPRPWLCVMFMYAYDRYPDISITIHQ